LLSDAAVQVRADRGNGRSSFRAGPALGQWLAGALLAALAGESRPAAAQPQSETSDPGPGLTVSGSVVLASDYLSRGLSLTGHRPALQMSAVVTHGSGLYATAWISNARFGEARSEVDLGFGYARTVGDVTVALGYFHYLYPHDRYDGDSSELHASVSRDIGPIAVKAGGYYSANTPYAASALYPYVEARMCWETDPPLSLAAHLGYLDHRKGTAAPFQNYAHWSLTASTRLKRYDLSLGYSDTSVRHGAAPRLGRATVLFTIGRGF